MAEHEIEVRRVIEAVYNDAQGFSIRDRDDNPEDIKDVGSVMRMRLSCRTSQNLMLSDEALNFAGTGWPNFQQSVRQWIGLGVGHQYFDEVQTFADQGFSRKDHNLKNI